MPVYRPGHLPYVTVMQGRAHDLTHVRVEGSHHRTARAATARALRWHDKWVALAPDVIYLYDWLVIDSRDGRTVWRWEQW